MGNLNTSYFTSSEITATPNTTNITTFENKNSTTDIKKNKLQYEEEKWEEWFDYWSVEKQKLNSICISRTGIVNFKETNLLIPDTTKLPYDWWLYENKDKYYENNIDVFSEKALTNFSYTDKWCDESNIENQSFCSIWKQFEPKPYDNDDTCPMDTDLVKKDEKQKECNTFPGVQCKVKDTIQNTKTHGHSSCIPRNYINLQPFSNELQVGTYVLGIALVFLGTVTYVKF